MLFPIALVAWHPCMQRQIFILVIGNECYSRLHWMHGIPAWQDRYLFWLLVANIIPDCIGCMASLHDRSIVIGMILRAGVPVLHTIIGRWTIIVQDSQCLTVYSFLRTFNGGYHHIITIIPDDSALEHITCWWGQTLGEGYMWWPEKDHVQDISGWCAIQHVPMCI